MSHQNLSLASGSHGLGVGCATREFTHFVSLPLAIIHPELVAKLESFKSTILGDSHPVLGIDKWIFIKPKTFHLTVQMLRLWDDKRIHTATEALQNASAKVFEVLENRPLVVRLNGLGIFSDCKEEPMKQARVLYARVEDIGNEDRLSRACQAIIDTLDKAGLIFEEDKRELKLHATIMNANFRRPDRNGRKAPFDASGIFEKFGTKEWGDYHIPKAHLSKRSEYENGYYRCCDSISLP